MTEKIIKTVKFVQLSPENCQYLLDLIEEMDSDTPYTARQRAYTIPKLKKILEDPNYSKLAYQDVDYLLDLIEDDDLIETMVEKEAAREKLLEIQALQSARFDETRDIEKQRELRRLRRLGELGENK